jgi:hypothetical protein
VRYNKPEISIDNEITEAGKSLLISRLTICGESMFLKRQDDRSPYDEADEKHFVYIEVKSPSVTGAHIQLTEADVLNNEKVKGNITIQFAAQRLYYDRHKEWFKWGNGDLRVIQIENNNGTWQVAKHESWFNNIIKFDCSELSFDIEHLESSLVSKQWLLAANNNLKEFIPDQEYRLDFINTVHSEATRAGLDPTIVLALIGEISGYRKYAISKNGAMGYMQLMPHWVQRIGNNEHNLFHLRTNLRYGCTILRHYLEMERGNTQQALIRYKSDLGLNNQKIRGQARIKSSFELMIISNLAPCILC